MTFRHRLNAILARLSRARTPNASDERYDEEAQFHIDMLAERFVRGGMSADDARRAALLEFGGRARYGEETRDQYRSRFLDDLGRDMRASLRTVRRHPAFAVATVATMRSRPGVRRAWIRPRRYGASEALAGHNRVNGTRARVVSPCL